ncbi:tyrosine-protein phosphatase [Calycomorphotria hydatis]|uniref:Dual specificity phosphatase, catalytic domain n=1 Tax=Calycomorphotria hydatis TaxID=2528027 RepID=A0A517T894_9PLAN|nr:tyrosine-protein phosphatase [Calycomorphotria hydatis]QDT64578.1 Dual specificity phosphatase, catalytic domain [Calycomorphotria hydatis]
MSTELLNAESNTQVASGKQKPPVNHVRRLLIAGGIVAGVAAAILIYDGVKYQFIAKRFGVVVPGQVYRSGQISKWMFEPTIEKYGIDVVVDFQSVDNTCEHQAAEIQSYEKLGLEHYRFPLSGDGTGDIGVYTNALAKIIELYRADRTVLVHCAAGTQRTGSLVAAFRLLELKQDPEEIYSELSKYDWNSWTDQALLVYLNANLPQVAEELHRRGILEEVPESIPTIGP